MTGPGSLGPLRVVVVSPDGEVSPWAALMGRGSIEVTSARSLEECRRVGADLAIAVGKPGEIPDLVGALHGSEDPIPAVLLVGTERPHPFVRWAEALHRGKQDWEESFDAIVDPVVMLNADRTIRRSNRAFAALTGRGLPEALGERVDAVFGDAEPAFQVALEAALGGGRPPVLETHFTGLQGIFQATLSPLSGSGGAAVVLRDVTPIKEREARIEREHRLADIGRLAGGTAHEISTPLASIALRAESLSRKAEHEELRAVAAFADFPRYLTTIVEETFRCKRIIGALLEFSRDRPPEVVSTDIGALTERAVGLMADQMKAKRVTFVLRVEPGLPLAFVDPGQMREVLVALLLNALDATEPGGRIEVEASLEPEGGLRLSVADNGCGIAPENLERIFTPFFTTKPVGRGTGMGLAICDGIVRSHGGEIRVATALGAGTRFTVALPLRRAAAATRSQPEQLPQP